MITWIFQGNPTKTFKVDNYLRTNRNIIWTVRQIRFRHIISPCDTVFIWRSDGKVPRSGGIIAKGRIVSYPEELEDDHPELWIRKPLFNKELLLFLEIMMVMVVISTHLIFYY